MRSTAPQVRSGGTSIALLLVMFLAIAACTRSEWQELAVSEGGFSVLMPAQPHYARQQVDTPAGKMFGHLYSSDRADAFYAVGYSDYPLAHVLATNSDRLLTGVRDTWIRRIDGRLGISSPRTLEGNYPGLEFSAEGRLKDQRTFLQARLYLVDQRLYQVIAMGPNGEVSQGLLNRFLDSFHLIEASEAGTINIVPPHEK